MSNKNVYAAEDFKDTSPLNYVPKPKGCCDSCFCLGSCCYDPNHPRVIFFDHRRTPRRYPGNQINNKKYNFLTFIPIVLYNQFKQFYNLFFLLIMISQMFPALRVGFLITYVAPLVFVLTITLIKEAIDDIKRWNRDRELNSEVYQKVGLNGEYISVSGGDIKVGDIVQLEEKKRIPADMILLHTSDERGNVFIKTDQLDGETDWKLRKSIPKTQRADTILLRQLNACIRVEAPHKDIYKFQGTFFIREGDAETRVGLDLENTLWANAVLANGGALGLVVYTGRETKSQLNARDPKTKTGKIDNEMSFMSFLLFVLLFVMSFLMVLANGFTKEWYVLLTRYILLLSYIIPISLRVNLDLAKVWYSWNISTDKKIPGTIARNTTIPEELGRIQMLFSDKTGTLTQNEMKFKSLYIGDTRYDKSASLDKMRDHVLGYYNGSPKELNGRNSLSRSSGLERKQLMVRVGVRVGFGAVDSLVPQRDSGGVGRLGFSDGVPGLES